MVEFPNQSIELLIAWDQKAVNPVKFIKSVGSAFQGQGHRHAELPGDVESRQVVATEGPDHDPGTDSQLVHKQVAVTFEVETNTGELCDIILVFATRRIIETAG